MSYTRRVIFTPYRRGQGPRFSLTIWDDLVPTWTSAGKPRVRYRLNMLQGSPGTVTLFEGELTLGYGTATDSDEVVRSAMTFLTLRPGDTDDDYFAGYTPEQLAYCDEHAEALSVEVVNRFGER